MAFRRQHWLHEHELTRRNLSELCSFNCGICSLEVRDAAYDCKECSYTLHQACASVEIPDQIEKHPFHPEHRLAFKNGRYSCDLCGISHDASVVIATPTPLEEEGTIESFYHSHPLTAFQLKLPNWISCKLCREPIPGPAYGCQTCDVFLHESCARLPREILQHPSHSQHPLTLSYSRSGAKCHACDHPKSKDDLAYYCGECDIHFDVMCTALLLSLKDQEKEDCVAIDHLSHDHQLLSGHLEESSTKLRCPACGLKISSEVYYCLGCSFFLHKQCADELPQNMAHYLHPEHSLVLLPKPIYSGGAFTCNCCQMVSSGVSFHCATCDFDLSLKCAVQTSSAVRVGLATKIQYFGHDHPLLLRYSCTDGNTSCRLCPFDIFGLTYSCSECKYNVHRSCAELPSQLEHPLHSHPLNLVHEEETCNNCSSLSEGFTFNCSECAFYLCFKCAIERPTLKHQLHEHTLCYFESIPNGNAVCLSCGEDGISDFYCCRRCYFNLHRGCLSLPPTIQHECHPYHPLVLFDRFVEGLPEYQYCDYCEELRNPDHGVYRCAREECWYTVHIRCVLPQATERVSPRLDSIINLMASLRKTIEEKKKELVTLERRMEDLMYRKGMEIRLSMDRKNDDET